VVDCSARFEELKIDIPDPVHSLDAASGILGVPRWWPQRGSDFPVGFHLTEERPIGPGRNPA
jgi:hypothetical protein